MFFYEKRNVSHICISLLMECKLQDGKVEYVDSLYGKKIIFISNLKVNVHVIEDLVLMIVLKRNFKNRIHA